MNVRPLRRTGAALALALLLGACRGAETPRAPLAEGDAAPGAWGERGDVLVAWALKADDCRGCGRPAAALRRLQAEHGDRVRLSALAVGGDGGAVAAFVRREGLRAMLVPMDARAYRRDFGDGRLPALYVIAGGRVAALWDDPAAATRAGPTGATPLEAAVRRALAGTTTRWADPAPRDPLPWRTR